MPFWLPSELILQSFSGTGTCHTWWHRRLRRCGKAMALPALYVREIQPPATSSPSFHSHPRCSVPRHVGVWISTKSKRQSNKKQPTHVSLVDAWNTLRSLEIDVSVSMLLCCSGPVAALLLLLVCRCFVRRENDDMDGWMR